LSSPSRSSFERAQLPVWLSCEVPLCNHVWWRVRLAMLPPERVPSSASISLSRSSIVYFTSKPAWTLGAHLRLLPDQVYLQAGVRKAARSLGLPASERSLPLEALPEPLRRLEPWHVENLLCIYKSALKRLGRRAAA
jgi:hypothetical protein